MYGYSDSVKPDLDKETNSELKADDTTSTPYIANTNVVCSQVSSSNLNSAELSQSTVKSKVQLFVRELDGLNTSQVDLILGCVQDEISQLREVAPLKSSNFVISS